MIDDELAGTLLDSSPDGLFLVDRHGKILVANRSAALLFGREVAALESMNVDELVPREQRAGHHELRDSYTEDPHPRPLGTRAQLFAEHADGTMFPVEISLSPVTVDDQVQTIATVRDVTERQEIRAGVALLEDRERIARDIHDMVIQRLFAAGMSLQAVAGTAEPPSVVQRIHDVTAELDDTIKELRAAIFHLGQPDHSRSLSSHIAALVHDRAQRLGFEPTLEVSGRLDALPDHVAEQLTATINEALSNVARHANATQVSVRINCDDRDVELLFVDDGMGIVAEPKPRGGISNMMWRAAELGGTCTVTPAQPNGTRLHWSVPS